MPLCPVHPDKVFPVPAMAPVLAPVVVPVLVVVPAAAAVLAVVGVRAAAVVQVMAPVRVAAAGKPVVDSRHHPSLKERHSRQNAPVCSSFVRNSRGSMAGCMSVPALVPVTIRHLHHLYPVLQEIYPVA